VVNLFLVTDPLRSWRTVRVSQQRIQLDFAHGVKDLVDEHEPGADRIVLVLGRLNTHAPASRSTAFPAPEA